MEKEMGHITVAPNESFKSEETETGSQSQEHNNIVFCQYCHFLGPHSPCNPVAMKQRIDDLVAERQSFKVTSNTSDGYHTFNELYDHRIELWIALCRTLAKLEYNRPLVWMSRLHSDGTAFDGWFVLGVNQWRGGQITYHLPDTRWEECEKFANVWDYAPDFDGHTSMDVLKRLKAL